MHDTDKSDQATNKESEKLLALLKGYESFFPWKTSERFPHVLDRLASLWTNPPATKAYFQQLLLTQREAREGFPREVYVELDALNELYGTLHPAHKKSKDNFWSWI